MATARREGGGEEGRNARGGGWSRVAGKRKFVRQVGDERKGWQVCLVSEVRPLRHSEVLSLSASFLSLESLDDLPFSSQLIVHFASTS